MGAKRLGGKRLGGKRLGGETTRGRNGLGAKRPGFLPISAKAFIQGRSSKYVDTPNIKMWDNRYMYGM